MTSKEQQQASLGVANNLITPSAKRTVSFSPTSDTAEASTYSTLTSASGPSSSAMTPTNSSGGLGTGSSTLKPALKAGTERKKLPPANQYQHPDPLLRRLRLVDNAGKAVDLTKFFDGVRVVAFYFSSQWAGQPLKEYHRTISEFAHERSKDFKVIYVSVDVDEQWYKAGTTGQPWVSMVWNDGSSLPAPKSNGRNSGGLGIDDTKDEPPPLYNNEDFLMAQEVDIDESLSKTDTSAPTVCIYHIEKQKMLDWNVRMGRLARTRRDETWGRWKRGEVAQSASFSEAISNAPLTFAVGVCALIYYIVLLYGGDKYNIVKYLLTRYEDSLNKASETVTDKIARSHVEF